MPTSVLIEVATTIPKALPDKIVVPAYTILLLVKLFSLLTKLFLYIEIDSPVKIDSSTNKLYVFINLISALTISPDSNNTISPITIFVESILTSILSLNTLVFTLINFLREFALLSAFHS